MSTRAQAVARPEEPQPVKVKAIISLEDFTAIYEAVPNSAECRRMWCRYFETACRVEEFLKQIKAWWQRQNGDAPGLGTYELVIKNAARFENKLYWCFSAWGMESCDKAYDLFAQQMRTAFQGGPLDTKRVYR